MSISKNRLPNTPLCYGIYTPQLPQTVQDSKQMGTAQHSQPCPHLPGLWAQSLCPSQGQGLHHRGETGTKRLLKALLSSAGTLGRIICNGITLYSKERSFLFLPALGFKTSPLGKVARGGFGLFPSPGVPGPGEVWQGCLSSLECLYYTHSAERNMLPPGTRSTRDPTGSHAKD